MLRLTKYSRVEDGKSSTVALLNFYIEEISLHLNYCRYVRKKNGGFFVALPSRKEGEEYFPYFKFEGEKNSNFQKAAQREVERYINSQDNESNFQF